MKKIICLTAALLLLQSAFGQIVTSNTRMVKEKDRSAQWYLRSGLNIMTFSGSDVDVNSNVGYDVTFGFHKPIKELGAYWGMDFGTGTRGYKNNGNNQKDKLIVHNANISPFTFGWKYEVVDRLKIDSHLGGFVSYDYAGKQTYERGGISTTTKLGDFDGWDELDAGMQVGIGVWYGRANLDFTYQRGFIKAMEDTKAYASNFMIRLGIAF